MPDRLRSFANAQTMMSSLADEIAARLTSAVARDGCASLVVSGGTTPGVLFDALSEHDAPWDRVWITLSDERWVSPSEDGSNEKLVRDRLLRNNAAAARFVAMKTDDATPDMAQQKVGMAIAAMHRPFAAMILGMGDDGHTASLYPGSPELRAALDPSLPALAHAVHAQNAIATDSRMTLSLRAILDSRWIVILIKGEEKMKTYRLAKSGSDVSQMPVRVLLTQSAVPVETFWAP